MELPDSTHTPNHDNVSSISASAHGSSNNTHSNQDHIASVPIEHDINRPLSRAVGETSTSVPIHRLPDDILIAIFEFLPKFSGAWNHYSVEVVIRISGVCRQWREVAVNTATLWTTVQFRHSALSYINIADLCISRSRNCPLDVEFWMARGGEDLHQFAELAASAAARWKSATIPFAFPGHLTLIIFAFCAGYEKNPSVPPLLEHLSLEWNSHSSNLHLPAIPRCEEAFRAFAAIAHPHSLELNNIKPFSVVVHFPYITHLTLFGIELDVVEFDRILTTCNQLRALNLCCLDPESDDVSHEGDPHRQGLISLPNLVSVSIYLVDHFIANRILTNVSAPSCETLEFVASAHDVRIEDHFPDVCLFFQRNKNMHTLSISHPIPKLTDVDWDALKNVRVLRIVDRQWPGASLSTILRSIPNHAFPQLSELYIKFAIDAFEALKDFVDARDVASGTPRSLRLFFDYHKPYSSLVQVDSDRAWPKCRTQLEFLGDQVKIAYFLSKLAFQHLIIRSLVQN